MPALNALQLLSRLRRTVVQGHCRMRVCLHDQMSRCIAVDATAGRRWADGGREWLGPSHCRWLAACTGSAAWGQQVVAIRLVERAAACMMLLQRVRGTPKTCVDARSGERVGGAAVLTRVQDWLAWAPAPRMGAHGRTVCSPGMPLSQQRLHTGTSFIFIEMCWRGLRLQLFSLRQQLFNLLPLSPCQRHGCRSLLQATTSVADVKSEGDAALRHPPRRLTQHSRRTRLTAS